MDKEKKQYKEKHPKRNNRREPSERVRSTNWDDIYRMRNAESVTKEVTEIKNEKKNENKFIYASYDLSSVTNEFKKKHTFIKSELPNEILINELKNIPIIIYSSSLQDTYSFLKENNIRNIRKEKDHLTYNARMKTGFYLVINVGKMSLDEYIRRSKMGDDVLTIINDKEGMEEVVSYLQEQNELIPEWLLYSEEIDDEELWK